MADIAKAYVQIVPTTKDIATNIKKAINSDSSSENLGESLGQKVSSGLKKAIIAAGIGTFIGKTIGDAIKNGADFEQLFGGAEKIFDGMDINKILNDSINAYKTMGMSANEYLEVINDVGAGFKASMGSEAGYETAKKGLKAISDYATGTGKDLNLLSDKFTMITRSTSSYQSIADQFSGVLPATSKAFLEQAQAAGDLGKQYKSLTAVPIAEYQSAVASALERGVDALNLTDNAAKEASVTISGSINAMKAAWQTFTTSLVIPEIDTKIAFSNFIKSFHDVVNNLTPIINELAPNIANVLGQAIVELGPVLANILGETISGIFSGIPEMLSKLDLGGAMIIITAIIAALTKLIPIITSIGSAIAEVTPVIAGVLLALDPVVLIIAAVIAGLSALGVALGLGMAKFLEWFSKTNTFNELNNKAIGILRNMTATFNETGGVLGWLEIRISNFNDSITRLITAILKVVIDGMNTIKTSIVDGITSALDIVSAKLNALATAFENVFSSVTQTVENWKNELISAAKEAIEGMVEKIGNSIASQPAKFKELGSKMALSIKEGFLGSIEDVKKGIEDALKKVVDKIKQMLGISDSKKSNGSSTQSFGASLAENLVSNVSNVIPEINSMLSSKIHPNVDVGLIGESTLSSMPNTNNMQSSNITTLESILSNLVINNQITLEGDADKLFKSVVEKNKVFINSTGRSAFAT